MRRFLQALPSRAELAIVVLGAFGYFLADEVWSALHPRDGHISETHLRWLLVYEPIVAAILLLFLHLRGWRPADLGLRPRWLDPVLGGLLFIVLYGIITGAWLVATALSPVAVELANDTSFVEPWLRPETVMAVSIVNPIFEEVFVVGYLVTALRRHVPAWVAITASTLLRLLYHLYQGPSAILTLVPWGVLCAAFYVRWARLWPLIVAHALFDFLALGRFVEEFIDIDQS